MDEFTDATGLSGNGQPRRHLWADAFAVGNFLSLFRQTGNERYLALAQELINQVHDVLGRHRADDHRSGWISGLSENDGKRHPTRGGLRTGNPFNENDLNRPHEQLPEWERDGQYYHCLMKWTRELYYMGNETGNRHFHQWATELATTAFRAFFREKWPGGPRQIVWKMSIDLGQPLVSSTGHHDPLDGLVTCLELRTAAAMDVESATCLDAALEELMRLCLQGRWASADPLGIGRLLELATRLAHLVLEHGVERRELLHNLLDEAQLSLQCLDCSLQHRPVFRELALAIGLKEATRITELTNADKILVEASRKLLPYQPLAERIQEFWSDPSRRCDKAWAEHVGINNMMLAASLVPANLA
jgi:hypothetical protein